jgi:predicted secreted Zn-dependent protease
MRPGMKINGLCLSARRRGRRWKRVAAAFCLLLLPAGPALAASLVKSYSYFTLDASTLDELEPQLRTRGPRVQSSGGQHPGATRMRFNTKTTYLQQGGRCRVADARTVLKVEVILPRWRPRRQPEADMRIIWDTLASDISRHEGQHVDIGKDYAGKLEQAIRSLGPAATCAEMAAKVKQATNRVLDQHDRAQLEFDRVESINFEDRFQRLLDYRLRQMEDQQSRGKPPRNR